MLQARTGFLFIQDPGSATTEPGRRVSGSLEYVSLLLLTSVQMPPLH